MFVFECQTHDKTGLVMFLGQYANSSRKNITSEIQKAYRKNLTPELVLFVYPKYLENEIQNLLSDEGVVVDLHRLKHSPVLKVSFDERGQLAYETIFGDGANFTALDTKKLLRDLVNSGFSHLMERRKHEVIVKAPAGTTFVKPSGKALEEFIYASQLARCNFEHQFIAMALLSHAPNIDKIDSIYIDTSSISSIAESVAYYIKQFMGTPCKSVTYKSFSSYSGLEEKIKPDNVDGTWVIISASATTSMGKKLVNDWLIDPKQVVTILSFSDCLRNGDINIGNDVVFCVKKYSDSDKKSFSPTKVQVQGESFSAEVSSPDKIALIKKFKPGYIDESIYRFCKGSVFSVNKQGHTLFVDYGELRKEYLGEADCLDKDADLYKWMLKTVRWTIPKNLSAIIYSDDDQSKILLEDFKSVLNDCGYSSNEIISIANDDQSSMEHIKDSSVLVLSSVVSTGHIFVDVNRALRLAGHTGMRIFATPYVVSPSEKQFKSVNSSLTQGTKGFKYHYVTFQKIFLSSKNLSPWDSELEVIKKIHNDQEGDADDFWADRKLKLESKSSGLEKYVGIHSWDSASFFELAKDFVFWPDGYEPDEINQSAVFATVGAILQNLRDNNIDGNQLSANIYKHTVLDPENFVRFNDPILQACLWRCALPGELDYRRSEALSGDLQRIFTKIFKAIGSQRGVTSIDLLMGLATRWIKVSSDEMKKIVCGAEEYLTDPHAKLLVQYLRSEFVKE